MRVIVDTCVWAQFLRRTRLPMDPVAQEVARLVRADALQMIGPIPITLHRERAVR